MSEKTYHNQEIDKVLIEKDFNFKSMSDADYLRINSLFINWKSWLLYLTFGYIFIFTIWSQINVNFLKFILSQEFTALQNCSQVVINWCLKFPLAIFIVMLRGLVFCADGIVSSWLKSPFGQITYSINKSGIESSRSDEIITVITEINENFKEAFKKFGIFTIANDFSQSFLFLSDQQTKLGNIAAWRSWSFFKVQNVREFWRKFTTGNIISEQYGNFATISLFVPVVFAIWRMKTAQDLIKKLRTKKRSEND